MATSNQENSMTTQLVIQSAIREAHLELIEKQLGKVLRLLEEDKREVAKFLVDDLLSDLANTDKINEKIADRIERGFNT